MTDLLLFYYSTNPPKNPQTKTDANKQKKTNLRSWVFKKVLFKFLLLSVLFVFIILWELQKKYERTNRQLTVCTKVSSGWFCWHFSTHSFSF